MTLPQRSPASTVKGPKGMPAVQLTSRIPTKFVSEAFGCPGWRNTSNAGKSPPAMAFEEPFLCRLTATMCVPAVVE